ncbi:hypothetical protein OG883_02435 [Streptomyces sp. NBC_01142]|uniref:hypothetical protein n=1 Tax=Streptomyces sp. NBC_01142 TaxID=2975865 RepID=UPI00225BB84F|nr:hypothetical protein [Streptomyces sp. NBC_01142]MCX4818776.1 hypothetical protein [Streptomyces sp. NBC_01142]
MFDPKDSFRRSDQLADAGDWDELLRLHEEADVALAGSTDPAERRDLERARGTVASVFIVEAPAPYAAEAARLTERQSSQRSSLLWEVLAQHWTWGQVGPCLTDPELRHLVAHARVMRGEDLTNSAAELGTELLGDIPFALESWEAAFWNPQISPKSYNRHGSAGGLTGIPTHAVTDRIPLPLPDTDAPDIAWTAPEPGLPGAVDNPSYAAVAGPLRCTAAQAASRHFHCLPIHERPSQAVPVTFPVAYPTLLGVLGGQGAYTSESTALGRIAVWRLLRRMAELPDDCPAGAVSEYVDGLTCLTWTLTSDEIWYVHLAVEHTRTGTSWLIDGQDID